MNSLIRSLSAQIIRGNRNILRNQISLAFYSIDTKKLEEITKNNKVVIFMKGNPDNPRCGFSNAVVQILRYL
jgi:hypothetical protein